MNRLLKIGIGTATIATLVLHGLSPTGPVAVVAATPDVVIQVRADVGIIEVRADVGIIQVRP